MNNVPSSGFPHFPKAAVSPPRARSPQKRKYLHLKLGNQPIAVLFHNPKLARPLHFVAFANIYLTSIL